MTRVNSQFSPLSEPLLNLWGTMSRFRFEKNKCFVFNYYSFKGGAFVVSMLLSKDQTSDIIRVRMSSLFSLKFFECCNAHYHSDMLFTPRELFTFVVIVTLIILMLSQLILWMVCISFSSISIDVTLLGVTLRRGGCD